MGRAALALGMLAAGLAALPAAAAAETPAAPPALTVYSYDSFVAEWGPGPAIRAGFEARCGCTVRMLGMGDGAALLARLRLEGARSPADVVIGLDTNLSAAAAATGLFAPHGVAAPLDLPVAWDDPLFLPYDWGLLAFVHDRARVTAPPASFAELAASSLSIIIEDPRSSSPGLGLLLWVKAAYGEKAGEMWQRLAPRILTVTPGWSEAYGLFLAGEADMVLSYSTSPAYHRIAEGDDTRDWARFAEGHLMQVELAARLAAAPNPDLASAFLAYLVSPEAQAVIPTTNWMYPAVMPAAGLPAGFGDPPPAARAIFLPPGEARALRDAALAEWLAALAR
ncbi:MAG: thiamine ABC transporter substrate binding subunit [Rhodobacteraceae bacterium]|nr:thiamine ABC transporter substrate binding subunit [Paracoccaceae bacterium]